MFGYVVANAKALNGEQQARYRGCYCGLCRTLKERHGELSRLTLNYDMTFLVLLLSGMFEAEEEQTRGRCGLHPAKPRDWWRSRYSDYAADMTVALAYFKRLDDARDERRIFSRADAALLRKHYEQVKALRPVQCEAIEAHMAELTKLEQERCPDPDAAAACFGRLMGDLFAVDEDPIWTPRLRAFGEALGRFVYMMDACVDRERDRRSGSYNPLLLTDRPLDDAEELAMLKMLAADCAAQFEALPILQDVDILRNVLYSGVWSQYMLTRKRRKGETPDE